MFTKAGVIAQTHISGSITSPLDIAGSIFWVKADSLALSDADPVSTWTDGSPNGNTVTSSLTTRPLYKTNIQNGLPVVRFDGSNDVMSKSGFSGFGGIAGMTIFIVVKQASLIVNKYLVSQWDYGTDACFGFLVGAPADELQCYVSDMSTDPGNNYIFTTDADVASAFNLIEVVYDGSLSNTARLKFYKNTTASSTATIGTIPTSLLTSSAPFRIGELGGIGLNYNGDFGEIIIYNSALSSTNRAKVETYLNARWALY